MNGYSWILILYEIHLHMRKELTIMRFGTLLVVEILIWKLYSKPGINALLMHAKLYRVKKNIDRLSTNFHKQNTVISEGIHAIVNFAQGKISLHWFYNVFDAFTVLTFINLIGIKKRVLRQLHTLTTQWIVWLQICTTNLNPLRNMYVETFLSP